MLCPEFSLLFMTDHELGLGFFAIGELRPTTAHFPITKPAVLHAIAALCVTLAFFAVALLLLKFISTVDQIYIYKVT